MMSRDSRLRPRIYRTNDVSSILGVETWRIKNFVQGKSFGIWQDDERDEKPGKRGKERRFTFEDLMRIDVANALCIAGFTPEVTGTALQKVTHAEIRRWANSYSADGVEESLMLVQASGKWKVLSDKEAMASFTTAVEHYTGFFFLNLTELWEATVRSIDRLESKGEI